MAKVSKITLQGRCTVRLVNNRRAMLSVTEILEGTTKIYTQETHTILHRNENRWVILFHQRPWVKERNTFSSSGCR